MFWFKKKDKTPPSKPSRAEIIAQAQENARKARAEIGEETIKKIAESFAEEQKKKEQAARQARIEKARNDIRAMDRDRIADHIKAMIREKKEE